ncbi:MAG: hypothetical protein JNM21_17245 [Taibaiella sp.]|nr:hypothetical protein [Taibaiella sp.]
MFKSVSMEGMLLFLLFAPVSCSNAQETKATQTLAVCTKGKGCSFSAISIPASKVDQLLGKTNFWTAAATDATLILDKCASKKEEGQTLEEIDRSYGGSGKAIALKKIDLEKYLKERGCFACPNATKKISFRAIGDGQSMSSFFYLNLKAGEAYMPNEAFLEMNNGAHEGMVIDQFIRNNTMETYAVAAGKKYVSKMPLATSPAGRDAVSGQSFKHDFKKTGKTRKHLNTANMETEYTGMDDEGRTISFWMVAYPDVCLPPGKFDAYGFYNLGYVSVEGSTYLVTEITGADFQVKITAVSDGAYQFDPAGYQSY